MTSRENRKQRREAERKARKLASRQSHSSPAPPPPSPEPSESRPAAAAYLAEMHAKADRELDEEFGAEFMAHAREVSDRMARRFGLPLWSGSRADVVQPKPRPAVNTASEIPPRLAPPGLPNLPFTERLASKQPRRGSRSQRTVESPARPAAFRTSHLSKTQKSPPRE